MVFLFGIGHFAVMFSFLFWVSTFIIINVYIFRNFAKFGPWDTPSLQEFFIIFCGGNLWGFILKACWGD